MTDNAGMQGRSHRTHEDPPPSSQLGPALTRAATRQQPLTSKATPAPLTFFDPWNSSSTGHQRAENRLSGSTSWRASRSLKLGEQYRGGLAGGQGRVADTVGAGSEDFGKDGRKENGGWEKGAKGLRTGGQKSLAEVWGATKMGKKLPQGKDTESTSASNDDLHEVVDSDLGHRSDSQDATSSTTDKQIFTGLCFYINGSTAPLISDHKLKHMLAAHGARHSISLSRRTVTHVILGAASGSGGAGGGIAATKIQKEVARAGAKGVKFINAEWVLESIKADRRLPESRFAPLKLTQKSQNSIFGTTLRDQG